MLNTDLLKDRAKKLNKNYFDIERETEIPYSTVTKLFTGRLTNPTSSVLIPILKLLNLKFEEAWIDGSAIVEQPSFVNKEIKEITNTLGRLDSRQLETLKNVIKGQLGLPTDLKVRSLKLFLEPACAGNGHTVHSDDYELVEFANPPLTAEYAVRAKGDSMQPLVDDGDILFIKTKNSAQDGDIVIATYHGDTYVKQIKNIKNKTVLRSLNKNYKDIAIDDSQDFYVCGIVL